MVNWEYTNPNFIEIRYEDLVNEPHTELCKLLEFMNVNRSNSVIEKCLSAGNFSKFSENWSRKNRFDD